jgi:hypothetical protein
MTLTFTTLIADSRQFFAVEIIGRKYAFSSRNVSARNNREKLYRIKNRMKSGREV